MWLDEAVMEVRVTHATGGRPLIALHPSGASIQWTDAGMMLDADGRIPESGWTLKEVRWASPIA